MKIKLSRLLAPAVLVLLLTIVGLNCSTVSPSLRTTEIVIPNGQVWDPIKLSLGMKAKVEDLNVTIEFKNVAVDERTVRDNSLIKNARVFLTIRHASIERIAEISTEKLSYDLCGACYPSTDVAEDLPTWILALSI